VVKTPRFYLSIYVNQSNSMNWLKVYVRRLCARDQEFRLNLVAQPWPARPTVCATLIVAPHPDDETLGCGMLIASRLMAGECVHVLILSDGSASHRDHPTLQPKQLKSLRQAESVCAMNILGLPTTNVHFLDLPDAELPHLSETQKEEARKQLKNILSLAPFDQVFTTWRHDASSEHEAAYALIAEKLPSSMRLLEYPIWARWSPWKLAQAKASKCSIYRIQTKPLSVLKRQALQSYQTQLVPVPPWIKPVLPRGFLSVFEHSAEYFFEKK